MSTTVDLGKITASVDVGTTTTGAAGTNASVTNVGTTQDAVLNFTIPRGAQGVQGPQGIQGNTGPAGPTGPQGPMGDVAVITPEQQAAFTMYSTTGQNTNGPMTQKAVTDALVAGSISYDNSQSGLAAENVQVALDNSANKINEITAYGELALPALADGIFSFNDTACMWVKVNDSFVRKHCCYQRKANDRFLEVVANPDAVTKVAFLTTYNVVNQADMKPYLCAWPVNIEAGSTHRFIIPDNCAYIVFNIQYKTTIYTPASVKIGRVFNTIIDGKLVNTEIPSVSVESSKVINGAGEVISSTEKWTVSTYNVTGGTYLCVSGRSSGRGTSVSRSFALCAAYSSNSDVLGVYEIGKQTNYDETEGTGFIVKLPETASIFKVTWFNEFNYPKGKISLLGIVNKLGSEDNDIDISIDGFTELVSMEPTSQNSYITVGEIGTVCDLASPVLSNYGYILADTHDGEIFFIKGRGGIAAPLWTFLDANNIILDKESDFNYIQEKEIMAPSGAVKVLFNYDSRYEHRFIRKNNILSELNQSDERIYHTVDISMYSNSPYWVNNKTNEWEAGASSKAIRFIPCKPNTKYYIKGNATETTSIKWMKGNDSDYTIGELAPISDYSSYCNILDPNARETLVSPPDAAYMCIMIFSNSTDRSPQKIVEMEEVDNTYDTFPADLYGKLVNIGNKCCQYILNDYCRNEWYGFNPIVISGGTELIIRTPAAAAHSLARLLASGEYNPAITFICEDNACKQVVRLVNGLVAGYDNWKHKWQAAGWAYNVAAAAYLLKNRFTQAELSAVEAIVIDAADYITSLSYGDRYADRYIYGEYWKDVDGTTLFSGDSKSEEVAWNNSLIALAVLVYPNATNIALYKQKLIEWSVIAMATPSDRTSGKILNGYDLSTLAGYNVTPDGIIINHNIIHPDYMVSESNSFLGSITLYGFANKEAPRSAQHHVELIGNCLSNYEFIAGVSPQYADKAATYSGTIYNLGHAELMYPNGNDWGTKRSYAQALWDVYMYGWGLSVKEDYGRWAILHYSQVQTMQDRWKNGKIFLVGSNENTYDGGGYGAEAATACTIMTAMFVLKYPISWTDSVL